jgi:hypothetical protein
MVKAGSRQVRVECIVFSLLVIIIPLILIIIINNNTNMFFSNVTRGSVIRGIIQRFVLNLESYFG